MPGEPAGPELGDLERVEPRGQDAGLRQLRAGLQLDLGVVDGASELLEDVFGERGVHSRAAIGTSVLPGGIPVEIELVVEVG